MKSTLRISLSLTLLLMSWSAQAQQIYMCKDATGRTVTSDRQIPECVDRAVRELGRDGTFRREIPAPLTPEQKREKQLQEAKAKADAMAVEEQRQSDRLMLARYASEKDIEASRQRSLDLVQEQIKRETKEMAAAEKNLKAAQVEADVQMKKKVAPSPDVKHRVDDAEQAIQAAKKAIQEHEAELAQINVKYDQTLKRYREITTYTAAR